MLHLLSSVNGSQTPRGCLDRSEPGRTPHPKLLLIATAGAWQTWIVSRCGQQEAYGAAARERRAQLEGFINPVVQLLHSDAIPDEDSIISDVVAPTGFLHAQLAS